MAGTPAGMWLGSPVMALSPSNDALHAVACEGAYFAGAQVEGAQAVVDGVGDEHVVAELFAQVFGYEGEAGGLVEAVLRCRCRRRGP